MAGVDNEVVMTKAMNGDAAGAIDDETVALLSRRLYAVFRRGDG